MTRRRKIPHPKLPPNGEIAGWSLWAPRAETIRDIREGTITPADARRLARWVAQWAKWVAYVAGEP